MSIDNLRSALPSYAKDMNLNLSSLPRITSLTEQQLWGAILATAAATKVDSVVVEIAAEAKEHLSDTAYEAALGAATIMGMNNIFYRTRGFLDGAYDVARVIEIGGIDIDRAIANEYGVDEHVADQYKRTDYQGAQRSEAARAVYQSIAIEIGRALNFYGFNNPDAVIEVAYCCGGGLLLDPLVEAVAAHVDLRVSSIVDVLPPMSAPLGEALRCPVAIGATMKAGR